MQSLNEILINLKSNDNIVLKKALDDLGDLNPGNALELTLPFLTNESKDIRETAVCTLGYIRNEKAIPYLIEKIENDEESVKKQALKSLEEYDSPEILKILLDEVYKEKKSRGPRQVIAEMLKKYPCKESQEALIYLIFNDEDYFVFIPAVDSLYSMNNKNLLETWLKIKTSYNHEYINFVAEQAIKDIKDM